MDSNSFDFSRVSDYLSDVLYGIFFIITLLIGYYFKKPQVNENSDEDVTVSTDSGEANLRETIRKEIFEKIQKRRDSTFSQEGGQEIVINEVRELESKKDFDKEEKPSFSVSTFDYLKELEVQEAKLAAINKQISKISKSAMVECRPSKEKRKISLKFSKKDLRSAIIYNEILRRRHSIV